MKGVDTSEKTTGKLKEIQANGFQAVGVYLRADRCSAAMIAELRNAGLKIWSTYEKGYPTTSAYFTQKQGGADGRAAANFAQNTLHQPRGSQIYATVDYDANAHDTNGVITEYMTVFKAAVEASGFVASVYGSGLVCRLLTASGLAKSGWLSQSPKYAEHDQYKPKAAIVQNYPPMNHSWDSDEIQQSALAGLW
jgi:hypothetical protein